MKAKVEMIEGAQYRTYGGGITEPLGHNYIEKYPWKARGSNGIVTYTKNGHEHEDPSVGSVDDLVEMVYDPRPPDFAKQAKDLMYSNLSDAFANPDYNRAVALITAALKAEYEATKGQL